MTIDWNEIGPVMREPTAFAPTTYRIAARNHGIANDGFQQLPRSAFVAQASLHEDILLGTVDLGAYYL